MGGRLREFITERIAAGTSFEQIARELAVNHGVNVSQSTIFRWARGYGLATAKS